MIAVINLVAGARELEESENAVENHVADVPPSGLSVAADKFCPRQSARQCCRPPAHVLQFFGVLWVDPVSQGCAEVGEGITNGAHLPIEHAHNPGDIGWIKHDIVVLVIILNQRVGGLSSSADRTSKS